MQHDQSDDITTPVINQIENLVTDVPGWTPIDQLFALFTLAYSTAHLPGDIVELGSWCGRSALALGLATKLCGKGKVHCVDLFPSRKDWRRNADGSYYFQVQIGDQKLVAYYEHTVWAEPFERDIAPLYERYESILDAFMETTKRNHLTEEVKPFRGDLRMFFEQAPPNFRCRLAFIDGDHSRDAVVNDISLVEKFLLPGGWICFDDAFASYVGVNQAITERIIGNSRYDQCLQLTRKFFVARFIGAS
jgi:predicted O-methyltransferase YrrM